MLSLLWAWMVEGQRPDRADMAGAALAFIGAALITFWPRSETSSSSGPQEAPSPFPASFVPLENEELLAEAA